jgi:hypothetical protein
MQSGTRRYAEMIEAVTAADINNFVARLLVTRPSLAVHGANAESIQYDTVLRR